MKKNHKIGVLALQGDFLEHINIFKKIGVEVVEVRLPKDLNGLSGLIIPGGESTVIAKLLHLWKLIDPIKQKVKQGMGIWGTCAGAIILAKHVDGLSPQGLQLMDIKIERNAFGRQRESFVIELKFPALGNKPFLAAFIRAPIISKKGKNVETLVKLDDGTIVAARQGRLLATSFHTEITDDIKFHEYFLQILDE